MVILGIIAYLAFRGYQLGPLLFPPPEATGTQQLSGAQSDWPSGRANLGGSGWASSTSVTAPFTILWEYDSPGIVSATPAVVEGSVYVATEDGVVAALDADTGDTLWNYSIGSPSDSAPAVAGTAVYVGARDHRLLSLDRDTGELIWEKNLGNIVLASPTVLDGTVYIGSTNGKLEALDALTGDSRWSARTKGWIVSHVASDGDVIAAGSLGERFITADPKNGRRLLKFYTGTPVAGGPIIADGRTYFVTNRGAVWAVDPHAVSRPGSRFAYVAKVNFFAWRLLSSTPQQTGSIWVASARGRVKFSPVYADGKVLVVNEKGLVTALDGATGSELWGHPLGYEVLAEPVAAGNEVLLATSAGDLVALDIASGEVTWRYDLGGEGAAAAPAIVGGTMYLPTADGRLLALGNR
jgi:outer membrane protein assembly factor BamB